MISVIIPYYQNTSGILRRALESIAQQDSWLKEIEVIIINDESPFSPEIDIDNFKAWPFKILIINQVNTGPGGARNTGLDHVSEGTRYIAFLDSDDEWLPNHLTRAIFALSRGYEFYFSDFFQLNQNCSAFNRAKRIDISEHTTINSTIEGLHTYQGDMVNQIITGNIIGTPTVVYLFQRFKNLRFDSRFKSAGEDYLFWLLLASRGAKIAFSSLPEVRCGQGVNIYSGAQWGSDSYLQRTHNEIRYKKEIINLYNLTNFQYQLLAKNIAELRIVFIINIIHYLIKSNNASLKKILKYFINDPLTFIASPFFIFVIAIRKIKKKHHELRS